MPLNSILSSKPFIIHWPPYIHYGRKSPSEHPHNIKVRERVIICVMRAVRNKRIRNEVTVSIYSEVNNRVNIVIMC